MLASPVSVGLLCGPDLFSPAPCWALFAVFFSARPPLSGGQFLGGCYLLFAGGVCVVYGC